MTTAKGRCVSEPMPCESAAGSKPRPAIKAVIRMGRKRTTAPSKMASATVYPSKIRCLICSTIITPFCTEIPANAINPTAAEMERWRPASPNPAKPPIRVNGIISSTSNEFNTDLNAVNKTKKISMSESGTITLSRFMERCWFSNCPPHVMAYPGGNLT